MNSPSLILWQVEEFSTTLFVEVIWILLHSFDYNMSQRSSFFSHIKKSFTVVYWLDLNQHHYLRHLTKQVVAKHSPNIWFCLTLRRYQKVLEENCSWDLHYCTQHRYRLINLLLVEKAVSPYHFAKPKCVRNQWISSNKAIKLPRKKTCVNIARFPGVYCNKL